MPAEEKHADHPGGGPVAVVVGKLSGVAVQPRMGLLPERRAWPRRSRTGDSAADGKNLATHNERYPGWRHSPRLSTQVRSSGARLEVLEEKKFQVQED